MELLLTNNFVDFIFGTIRVAIIVIAFFAFFAFF